MRESKTGKRHVALMVDTSRAFGRGVCRGVAEYFRDRDDLLLMPYERPVSGAFPSWLKPPFISGVIAYISDPGMARRLWSLGVPVVDVHGRYARPDVPVVEPDSDALVRLAVDFFLRAGFANLAYCGTPGIFFSDTREGAFRRMMREKGARVHIYAATATGSEKRETFAREREQAADEIRLARWIGKLPQPVAVLTCNDIRGQQIVNAARLAGLDIPGRLLVLGVDDDEVICDLCSPRLSSIAQDLRGIGRIAAEKLDAAIASGRRVGGRTRVPPLAIVERGSTDALGGGDPLFVRAGRILRARAKAGVSVKEICIELKCSRSNLDALFRSQLGATAASELTRIRLDSIRQSLLACASPLSILARDHGFASAAYLCRFFRRETGMTPTGFRESEGRPATTSGRRRTCR